MKAICAVKSITLTTKRAECRPAHNTQTLLHTARGQALARIDQDQQCYRYARCGDESILHPVQVLARFFAA